MIKYKLGEFLIRQKESTLVEDGKLYKRAKIRINHNGISVRDEVDGSSIRTKKQFLIHTGQFLLSKIDARNGAFGIVPKELEKGIITGNFWTFDVDQTKVLIDFLKAFTETKAFADICIRASSGTTNRKYLDEKKFLNIEIDVPSVLEQKSVINHFKEKKNLLNNFKLKSAEQEDLVSKLRQSILQEAVQGKLTSEWRTSHPELVSGSNHASQFLKRIQEEKAQLIADKKIKNEKALPPITKEDIPYELPVGWIWCRMQDLCPNISSGSTPPKPFFRETGIPYLKVYNIRNQKINFSYREQFVEEEYHKTKLKRSILNPGDVIMNIVGPPLGKVAIIPDDYPEWNCNQAISFFKPLDKRVNIWIYTFLLAGTFLKHIELIGTAGQDNISVTKSKNIMIPFPPLEEQKAIVEKVNALMGLCDALEQEVQQSQAFSELLMQSVLREVFAGERKMVEV